MNTTPPTTTPSLGRWRTTDPPETTQAADGTLEAGPVSFELHNDGTEAHELLLLRKNDGVTLSTEELLALPQEEGESMTTFIGVAEPVPAGEGSHLVADLEPGDYVAVCFIPTGTTSFDGPPGDGPPHMAHGMIADLIVT